MNRVIVIVPMLVLILMSFLYLTDQYERELHKEFFARQNCEKLHRALISDIRKPSNRSAIIKQSNRFSPRVSLSQQLHYDKNLNTLDASDQSLLDFSFHLLGDNICIEALDASYNFLQRLPLGSFPYLRSLNVANNRLKDTLRLVGYPSLEFLRLENQQIKDFIGSLKIIVECLNLGKTVNYGKRLRRFVKTT